MDFLKAIGLKLSVVRPTTSSDGMSSYIDQAQNQPSSSGATGGETPAVVDDTEMQMVGVEGPIRYEDVYPRPTSLSPPRFVDVWVPPPPNGTSFGAPVHPSSLSSSPSSSPRTPTKHQALSTLSTIAFNSSPRSISRTVAILATDATLVEDADTFDIEWCVRLVAFLRWTCPPPFSLTPFTTSLRFISG